LVVSVYLSHAVHGYAWSVPPAAGGCHIDTTSDCPEQVPQHRGAYVAEQGTGPAREYSRDEVTLERQA
jgi:hypothetical protein